MNRINQLFENKKKGILSIYFCAGFPQLNTTHETLLALQDNGVDMVEIGIPFSDPLADGPIIQDAATHALHNGMSVKKLFSQLHDIRKDIHIPLILMGYLNPIIHFGFEAFCRECMVCGIDGLIIPDLPFEVYEREFHKTAEQYGIAFVFLVTPETPEARIHEIDAATDSFIYAVSSAAVTGVQHSFDTKREAYFRRLKNMKLKHPFLVGFGVSNRSTRESAEAHSCGVIVGSKFVTLLKEYDTPDAAVKALIKALNGN